MRVYVGERSTILQELNRNFDREKPSSSLYKESGRLEKSDFFLVCDAEKAGRSKVINLTRGCAGFPARGLTEIYLLALSKEVEGG